MMERFLMIATGDILPFFTQLNPSDWHIGGQPIMHAGAVMQTELACSLSGCDDSTAAAELYSLSLLTRRQLVQCTKNAA